MLNDYFQFDISEHLISALINGDYSGLNSEEEKLLNGFVSQYSDYKNATWGVESEEGHFIDCDVTGLFSTCYDVKLHFTNDAI